MLLRQKNTQPAKGNRFLISVTVLGSAGPIRFVVNEEERVVAVIDLALKSYAREGRFPALGSDLDSFILYSPIAGTEALIPSETIGSVGGRNFILCRKPHMETEKAIDEHKKATAMPQKERGIWKIWFQKSHSVKISSH